MRIKLPGAWWTATSAESMLALPVNRANDERQSYCPTNGGCQCRTRLRLGRVE